jgi:CRISPR-associated protein Cmr4
MYKNKAYIISNQTNLHVGSGDTNFGIVDKEVQRDPISSTPVIHSSSLKGAIRNHFVSTLAPSNQTEDANETKPFTFDTVFGSENKQQGLVKFMDARLVFLPLRSNKKPFYHTTSLSTLKELQKFLNLLDINIDLNLKALQETDKSYVVGTETKVVVEDIYCDSKDIDISYLKELFGVENVAIFSDEDFNEALTALPVIARNKLEDGTSVNLWYEEVVPRDSRFVSILCYYDNFNEEGKDRRGKIDKTIFEKAYKRFESKLLKDTIQIGANESIGYGVCHFTKIGESDE